eukprot:1253189-Alexandrium_andersonii.AAC.1
MGQVELDASLLLDLAHGRRRSSLASLRVALRKAPVVRSPVLALGLEQEYLLLFAKYHAAKGLVVDLGKLLAHAPLGVPGMETAAAPT